MFVPYTLNTYTEDVTGTVATQSTLHTLLVADHWSRKGQPSEHS